MSDYISRIYIDVINYPCPNPNAGLAVKEATGVATCVIVWPRSLQWRHNDHDSVSNHQPQGCLLNRLFRRRSKNHQSSASLAFVWGIHRDRWIPRTKGQLRGKCFHLMTSSCIGDEICNALWAQVVLGYSGLFYWISNDIHYNAWDEITHPFPNFNGCTV